MKSSFSTRSIVDGSRHYSVNEERLPSVTTILKATESEEKKALGDIEQEVSFNETGYIDLSQFKKTQPTIFSKYGNKVFGLIILLYIFLFFSFNRINNE